MDNVYFLFLLLALLMVYKFLPYPFLFNKKSKDETGFFIFSRDKLFKRQGNIIKIVLEKVINTKVSFYGV